MGAFWGRNFYLNGSSENDIFGWDIVLSSDGTRLAISDPNYDTNESRDVGYVAVYDLSKNAHLLVKFSKIVLGISYPNCSDAL